MELTRLLRSLETFVALYDHEELTQLYRQMTLQCGSKASQWTGKGAQERAPERGRERLFQAFADVLLVCVESRRPVDPG